jgi:DHA1 family florfenicol/chloramphenicol resistance protein-like MFS transporter
MDIYLPVVPEMPERLGTTPAVVQLTLSLYMAVLGLGQIVFGPLSDRVGRRPVLLGGGLLFAAASLALAMTDTGPAFVALRILQAAGASAAMVATFATVRDVYAERPEGAVIYGLLGSILSFVPALGPVAGALIAQGLGWRAIFGGLALLMAAALVNAWRGWGETRPSGTPAPTAPLRRILSSYAFWTYTLGFSAAMGAFFVFFSTAPRVLIGQAGFSQLGFSLAFATAAVVMIVTSRFAKWFVGRWGVAGCLARGMAALLCGAALLATGQLWGEPSFWSFVAPMWVMAVGIVLSVSVSANGALAAFGSTAGDGCGALLLRRKPDRRRRRHAGGGVAGRAHGLAAGRLCHGDGPGDAGDVGVGQAPGALAAPPAGGAGSRPAERGGPLAPSVSSPRGERRQALPTVSPPRAWALRAA